MREEFAAFADQVSKEFTDCRALVKPAQNDSKVPQYGEEPEIDLIPDSAAFPGGLQLIYREGEAVIVQWGTRGNHVHYEFGPGRSRATAIREALDLARDIADEKCVLAFKRSWWTLFLGTAEAILPRGDVTRQRGGFKGARSWKGTFDFGST